MSQESREDRLRPSVPGAESARRAALVAFSLGALFVCLPLLTATAWAQQSRTSYTRIDTFAGLRVERAGLATKTDLNYPRGVAVDGAGNVYIADALNQRIWKVDSSGRITTVAGTGIRGFSGDGGPAVQAQFDYPYDLALDGAGNLYIPDSGNHRVRKVDASSGKITTVAGTGTAGFSGDGGLATAAALRFPGGVAVDGAGNLYIADSGNERIR